MNKVYTHQKQDQKVINLQKVYHTLTKEQQSHFIVACNFSTLNNHTQYLLVLPYSGKVWWGESLTNLVNRPRFAKLKLSKLVITINYLLADLLIRQTFFCQMLETSQFAKLSPCQSFSLYGNSKHWSADWRDASHIILQLLVTTLTDLLLSKLCKIKPNYNINYELHSRVTL